jgi:MinD-like ATPase involved in chromosome partitioning or flagellar assembly
VDLPTYTSIWRIEKRLYKLYDFKLPMPVPVGQIAVFAAITVPYVILLTVLGLPFNHTLFWLYVLPPAVLTWLATRPVLESKRLPELVISQVRYLGEPGTWCRMNPLAEKDDVVVVGKVWRRAEEPAQVPAPAPRPARPPAPAQAQSTAIARRPVAAPVRTAAVGTPQAPAARPAAFGQPASAGRATARPPVARAAPGRTQRRVRVSGPTRAAQQVWEQARATPPPPAAPAKPASRAWPGPASARGPATGGVPATPPAPKVPGDSAPARPAPRPPEIAHDGGQAQPSPAPAPRVPTRPRWPDVSPGPGPGAGPPPADLGHALGEAAPAGPAKPAEATAAPPGAPPAGLTPPGPVLAPRVPDPKPNWFRSVVRRPAPDTPAAPPRQPPGAPRPTGRDSASGEKAPAAAGTSQPAGPLPPPPGGPSPAPAPGEEAPAGAAPPSARTPRSAPPAQAPAEDGPADAAPAAGPAPPPAGTAPAPAEDAPAPPAPAPAPERPTADPAGPTPRTPPVVVVRGNNARPTMVERALGGPGQHRNGISWREHVRVVPGGHRPGRPDMEQRDRARALLPVPEPRLAVVLGCTVGAGQTITTLMIAEVLASLRSDTVAALDLNPGHACLASLACTAPVATVRSLLAGPPPAVPPTRGRGRPDLIAHDTAAAGEGLSDPDYARLVQTLASRYPLTLADPGASAVARLLAAADQLVLVTPASSEAARAVAMTMEWLDGHGYAELCARSIGVINGVSKRSMSSAEQAELVISGRSHAIVRVPWDDHLAEARPGPGPRDGLPPAGPAAQFSQLRPQAQHAYTALAGVLVSALTNAGSAVGGKQRRTSP